MADDDAWPDIPAEEMDAFYATADIFLNTANGMVGAEPAERVAAAFLFASVRFTAFAMEVQSGDAAAVGEDARDWLTNRFDEELRDHALQQLRREAAAPVPPGQTPDAAIDVLMALNDMDPVAHSAFMRLGDRFIGPANEMVQATPVARISAAMMHACARFNAYVMQTRGLMPGPLDDQIVADFRSVFRTLLDYNLGQSLVSDRPE